MPRWGWPLPVMYLRDAGSRNPRLDHHLRQVSARHKPTTSRA